MCGLSLVPYGPHLHQVPPDLMDVAEPGDTTIADVERSILVSPGRDGLLPEQAMQAIAARKA